MLKDITWGQYDSRDSLIHRLDPRVKIRFTILYIILLLLDRNLPLFAFLTGVYVVIFVLSKVSFKKVLKGSTGFFVFVFICSAINIFTVRGTTLVKFGTFTVTEEGLLKFGFVFWRMVLLILMSSLLMYTTTPTRLTDGLEKCFHLHSDVALGITIALRFIPILFEELDRIIKAQEARGANFRKGSPKKRLAMLKNVLVPLIQNAIHKAGNLGDAMDARCYTGGKSRTKLNPLVYTGKDVLCYVLLLGILILGIFLAIHF